MESIDLELEGGKLRYIPGYLPAAGADALYTALDTDIPWQQEYIHLYGKTIAMPRLTAWIGDPGASYRYSGKTYAPEPWPAPLQALRTQLETDTGLRFNAVLANCYRDGNDSVSWHADNEPELQPEPQIASISLGATRRFQLRNRHNRARRHELPLEHGSLLLMLGNLQAHWQHQLPKTRQPVAQRINLTFRLVRRPGEH